MLVIILIITFLSTFIGGLVGIKHRDRAHLILGFTAGVLIAVVAFDILPEIFELLKETSIDPVVPMITLVIGFLAFHVLEKMLLIHKSQEQEYGEHKHPTVGVLSALALSGHSFLDGVGIGIGFQVSPTVGLIIAAAVIAHDFSDGLNTVSLMLAHKNTHKRALKFLLIDAITPFFGAMSTLLFTIPKDFLVIYLGFFAGFLLYIGASDILPEAHSKHSSYKILMMTIIGTIFIFSISRII